MKDNTFDYIVVGAGSAGCVLANRLSADPDCSVLLIEAGGPDKRQEIRIPAAFSKLFKSPCDWAYFTEEQPHLNNRRLYWPRGKMLGGCSSINAMIYTRGNPDDYDHWQQLGNENWGFAQMLPFFAKVEDRQSHPAEGSARPGQLAVSPLRTVNPLSRAFVAACAGAGIPRNEDFNAAVQEGCGFFQVTQKNGMRHSAAAAYLKPALKRPNLFVQTFAQATRILIEGGRAAGVEYLQKGAVRRARAQREVLLAAGAVNSPQLLMLSGIGPADELRQRGISPMLDLPGVGGNLQDHLNAGVSCQCTRPVSLAGAETLGNLLNFLLFRKGMLTSNVAEAGAFIKSAPDLPAPDLELIFGPVYYMNHGFSNPPGHGFSIGAILLHPHSLGRIRLRSNHPLDTPAIQPGYLSREPDRRRLLEGVRLCRELAHSQAFDRFRGEEVWPGKEVRSDQELAGFIGETAETLYHPVGTCKMGNDALAVVDDRLKVRGIEGLRVVDASIMPAIVTGHPNAAVIAIGEKAAGLILEQSRKADQELKEEAAQARAG